jgi:hypothetical protein
LSGSSVSGGALPQPLLNVPLTVALLSYGAMFLFLLWYGPFFEGKP